MVGTSDRRVTIATVAARVGRSISTVSAALNGADGVAASTREEILHAARDLGYEADPRASLLRRSRTGLIGVSYFAGQDFQIELVDGLYAAAARHGVALSLTAATAHHSEEDGLRELVRGRCEAIVIVDHRIPMERIRELAGGIPLVVLCREGGARGVDVVRADDWRGTTELVEHVLATGRTDLLYIAGTGPGEAGGGPDSPSRLRARACARVMEAHGLAERLRIVPGGEDEAAGARAVTDVLETGRAPEAVVCFNDHAAIGAMMELRRHGLRVPEDVAVAGYDGIPLTGLGVIDLTTVDQNAATIAETAMHHLAGRLGRGGSEGEPAPAGVRTVPGEDGTTTYAVEPRLIVRGSTA